MLRVATFNIQHGRPVGGGPVDAGAVAAACAGLDADVLALHEVDRGMARSGHLDLARAVARRTGMELAFGPTLHVDGGEYGNALLVRGRICTTEEVPLPGWGRREPRAALVAAVSVGGFSLRVAATHLGVHPVESARQLDALLGACAGPAPRLLLGDFNRQPFQVRPAARRAGFTVVGGPPTFPARVAVRRIDHILVDGFTVDDVTAVRTAISDHRALVAGLRPAQEPAAKSSTI